MPAKRKKKSGSREPKINIANPAEALDLPFADEDSIGSAQSTHKIKEIEEKLEMFKALKEDEAIFIKENKDRFVDYKRDIDAGQERKTKEMELKEKLAELQISYVPKEKVH